MRLEPSRINELLKKIEGRRVLVLGDVMLDRYEKGEAVKLSREAPVPVLRKVEQAEVPGGAANAAMNVRSLKGIAHLIGVVGKDQEAYVLRKLLDSSTVSFDLLEANSRPTTLKTRFIQETQQFLRLDRETSDPISEEAADDVIQVVRDNILQSDCVLFSDYAKGFFSPTLAGKLRALVSKAGIPLVVDPKPENSYLCEHCFLFMPNRMEGSIIAGGTGFDDTPPEDVAKSLAQKYGTNVLLTIGKDGMLLAAPGADVTHIPSRAREVYDVSGAGDTVAAAVSLAVGAGLDLVEAAALANEAAGVVVSKLGTAVATPDEIKERAGAGHAVIDWESLKAEVDKLRLAGKNIVFTNGCFDLLHAGHIKYLKAAKALGDALVVALNSDDSVRRLKGSDRPLINEWQRAELVSALEFVDYVTVFEQDTPVDLIDLLKPEIFVKGGDYTEEMLPEAPAVRAYGGSVDIVPLFESGISTSEIIDRISGSKQTEE